MSLQNGPYVQIPHSGILQSHLLYSDILLDAADEAAAFIFKAPKTGSIRKIAFRTATVTNGATVDVRLETVDLTSGNPTGTLVGTNTNVSQVIANADDNTVFVCTLTADGSVTAGNYIAAVIKAPSSGSFSLNIRGAYTGWTKGTPYAAFYTPSTWTRSDGSYPCYIEYSDGTRCDIGVMGVWNTFAPSATFNNTTTIRERALYFKLPWPCKMIGCVVHFDLDGDTDIILYDTDGTTQLFSASLDTNCRGATDPKLHTIMFGSAITLVKDSFYRLAVKPTSATNIAVVEYVFPSTTVRDYSDVGPNFYLSTKNNLGAWSEADPNNRTRPNIGLLLSAFDDGVSAGGGGFPILGGSVVR